MTKSAVEVATEALRHIGVADIEDTPDAADISRTTAHLTSLHELLSDTEELAPTWTIQTVPEALFIPLSIMLSGTICGGYSKPQYIPEYKRGLGMVRDYELNQSKVDGRPVPAVYF